jgi:hypothetical protein
LPWRDRGPRVEDAVLENVRAHAGEDFRPELFLPYVQVHEFEAILFSKVEELAEVGGTLCAETPVSLTHQFEAILDEAGAPEAINDRSDRAPSSRIAAIVHGFRKPLHGAIVAQRIGLPAIRAACPHFNTWYEKLERL